MQSHIQSRRSEMTAQTPVFGKWTHLDTFWTHWTHRMQSLSVNV
jgi:hypothetical protein